MPNATDPIDVADATNPRHAARLDACAVAVPHYDRSALARSILHIGVGGFHRAHLATYIDDLCRDGNTDWSIVGIGALERDQAIADALTAQDGLYALISRGAESNDIRVIGSIVDFVLAHPDPAELIERIAAPTTQIVSLTITEGGYPVDDTTNEFIAEQCTPGSTFDLIARGLDERRARGAEPITILSCDNIMKNGEVARVALMGAAATISAELVTWINASVAFPNSMVDRITPMTTPADTQWLATEAGVTDRWPVVAEPFRQWVIEDSFAGARLPLEDIDVIITDDIEPYELTKLRLLNAGHSCLAYLAALDGYTAVDKAMADDALRTLVERILHDEARTTLPKAAGIDVDVYITTLIERFSNPAISDQISRLCLDGTAKFPKFLLPTIEAQLLRNGPIELAALALAGWCEYLATFDEPSGDPLLDLALTHARNSLTDPASFLDFSEVFGPRLRSSSRLRNAFADALKSLRESGVQSTVFRAIRGAERE